MHEPEHECGRTDANERWQHERRGERRRREGGLPRRCGAVIDARRLLPLLLPLPVPAVDSKSSSASLSASSCVVSSSSSWPSCGAPSQPATHPRRPAAALARTVCVWRDGWRLADVDQFGFERRTVCTPSPIWCQRGCRSTPLCSPPRKRESRVRACVRAVCSVESCLFVTRRACDGMLPA